jgi:beta-ribofuranosylaminobenzene 5'-phosphate synthase
MHSQPNTNLQNNAVTVTTSARLHMGFFDLTGAAARKFGSLGLSIEAPCTQIVLTKSDEAIIDANCSENAVKIVENITKLLEVEENFSLKILQSIPQHAGLGSGTQLVLAIGAGLNALFNLNLSVSQIAQLSKRGSRSGIGIAAFEQGGVLLDGGKISHELPEIALRQAFPDHWRVLLIADSANTGVHGEEELQAFQSLKPAQHSLRDMVFDHMMPALQRADILAFGACMAELQAYNGEYFAPIQGGHYASKDVEIVLNWLQQNGVACVGQSSWGPTGFAILENQQQAELLQNKAQLAFAGKSNISFQICRGKNTGASIQRLN